MMLAKSQGLMAYERLEGWSEGREKRSARRGYLVCSLFRS
jgi:hypothetical protein